MKKCTVTFQFFIFLLFMSTSFVANSAIGGFKFKPREAVFGQIDVPLDWGQAEGPKISIAYKLMSPDNVEKPLLIFIGGGPAAVTIENYHDVYRFFGKHYRILTFDQRGVGYSSPIELDHELGSATEVLRLFGPTAIARDLKALVNHLVGLNEGFLLAGHSFGTLVAYHYIAMPSTRLPERLLQMGPVSVTQGGPQSFLNERLKVQIALNLKLAEERPGLKLKLELARIKFNQLKAQDKDNKILGNELDSSFYEIHPDYWNSLEAKIDRFLMDSEPTSAIAALGAWSLFNEPLLYAVDWAWPKRISQQDLVSRVPSHILGRIQPWMLIETRAILSKAVVDRFPESQRMTFDKLDSDLAGQKTILDVKTLKKRLWNLPSIYLAADRDPFVPYEEAKRDFSNLFTNKTLHHFEPVEGGSHWSMISEAGAAFVQNQFAKIQDQIGKIKSCEETLVAK